MVRTTPKLGVEYLKIYPAMPKWSESAWILSQEKIGQVEKSHPKLLELYRMNETTPQFIGVKYLKIYNISSLN